jgi:hypothetical protein
MAIGGFGEKGGWRQKPTWSETEKQEDLLLAGDSKW